MDNDLFRHEWTSQDGASALACSTSPPSHLSLPEEGALRLRSEVRRGVGTAAHTLGSVTLFCEVSLSVGEGLSVTVSQQVDVGERQPRITALWVSSSPEPDAPEIGPSSVLPRERVFPWKQFCK